MPRWSWPDSKFCSAGALALAAEAALVQVVAQPAGALVELRPGVAAVAEDDALALGDRRRDRFVDLGEIEVGVHRPASIADGPRRLFNAPAQWAAGVSHASHCALSLDPLGSPRICTRRNARRSVRSVRAASACRAVSARPSEEQFRAALQRDRERLHHPAPAVTTEIEIAGPYAIIVDDSELDEYVVWER